MATALPPFGFGRPGVDSAAPSGVIPPLPPPSPPHTADRSAPPPPLLPSLPTLPHLVRPPRASARSARVIGSGENLWRRRAGRNPPSFPLPPPHPRNDGGGCAREVAPTNPPTVHNEKILWRVGGGEEW